ncbi:PepSY domain-containing protein [Marinobacterium sediminicola]|uniref:Peptidase propeptide and YPEB domain-containing protein n=1 Tax=Marinobacterium sediminicola TaxID=518898 RepID=A0ABY1RX99_9GAMM|nr:PepSY domain-containing protein [Marinobacterium sediminicola]ULG67803.1 PepSY domain-containing protein [Marinobacterium sediminicola]SMR71521.1 Peptidase propeptide and YPEB domain-containing protein [Marinobacterium sediminicola]
MVQFKHLFSLTILLVGGLASATSFASRHLDQDEVLELVREGKIRPLSELMALNPERFRGHLLDVEIEYEDGVLIYEIELLDSSGVVREFELDPLTGDVLKEEIED